MPTADQHRRKADKNRRLLAALDLTEHPEWAVTIAFYTALHRVEQLRHAFGDGHSRDHTERLNYLYVVHRPVHEPFERLYIASRTARYESAADFFAEFDADAVRDRVIGTLLAAVETFVADQTAPPKESAP